MRVVVTPDALTFLAIPAWSTHSAACAVVVVTAGISCPATAQVCGAADPAFGTLG